MADTSPRADRPSTSPPRAERGRPTLAAVAARAGVSPSTASLAFSGQGPVSESTRERVLQAASDLGYAGPDPRAAGLRRGRSGIVAAVLASRIGVSFRDPVMIQTLDGLAEELGSIGSGLLLVGEASGPRGAGRVQVADAPIDAAVLLGCGLPDEGARRSLARRGVPVAVIEADPIDGCPVISVDNRGGSRRLARMLHDAGHTRVAVVALGTDDVAGRADPPAPIPLTPEGERQAIVPTRERLAGARGIFPDLTGVFAGPSRAEDGARAAGVLLDVRPEERPTAIIAQSDLLAAGVIHAARERGLSVPEDLSVVGFDGIRVDNLDLRLTTAAQPAQAKGEAAARAVIALMEGRSPIEQTFPVAIVPGETVAPPAS